MTTRRSVSRTLASLLPAEFAVAAVGFCYTAVAVWNFWQETRTLASLVGPVLAGVANVGLSLALVGVSVWLGRSSLPADRRWTVAGWTLLGSAVALSVEGFTIAVRLLEGRVVSEPQFSLIVVGTLGGLLGAFVGKYAEDARSEARRAKETRDAMAFTNSLLRHDVLNGLQIMHGHAELVAEDGDGRLETSGEALERQVETLTDLVEEVRAVSETLLGEADPEPIDLVAVLDDAIESAADADAAATIETDLPESLPARGTPALNSVFTNLCNNAVQHTDSGVHVRVEGSADVETVTVTIADDGPGIPASERERIFESGVTSDGGDGGLGLHIVATILERTGGSITVTDSDLGGAAFVVTLPRATAGAEKTNEGNPFG